MRSEYTLFGIKLPNRALPSSIPEDRHKWSIRACHATTTPLYFATFSILVYKQWKHANLYQAPDRKLRPHDFLQAAFGLHLVFKQQTANVSYYFITKLKSTFYDSQYQSICPTHIIPIS
jgi:hypothetical protein